MSAKLETHAEIVKIAHLLGVDPAEVEYLAKSDAATLVELRLQLIDLFYGDENSNLKRFAKLGNLLPSSVIAGLTREAVGPILAARIAGFVDPKQAASVVSKLPPEFVVDIAIAIDPRRVAPVVGRLDSAFVEELAIELVRREEYVTMGQFIGFAPDEVLHAAFNFANDEALLRTAFVAEDKDRISVALAPQTDERIASIIKTAIQGDLWPEALDLFTQLSGEQYVRVINLAAKSPAGILDKMIVQTTESDCWSILLPAVAGMENPNRAAEALLRAEPGHLQKFASTVATDQAWEEAAALASKLSEKNLRDLAFALIAMQDYELIGQLIALASPAILDEAFATLDDESLLRTALSAVDKDPISVAIARQDDKRITSIIKSSLKGGFWHDTLELFTELSDEQYLRVINIAGKLPPATLDQMIEQTTASEDWQGLIPAISQMENPNRACEALLRADSAHVKAFAGTVIKDKAWKDAEELLGKLTETNQRELIKRLTRLKLAEGFVQSLPVIAA